MAWCKKIKYINFKYHSRFEDDEFPATQISLCENIISHKGGKWLNYTW